MLVYRKEIDGLRAIAVLPVILYHAGYVNIVPGGYVGVDIFFVISGYLITSLIDMEIRQGTFSLIRFYERRCRRILPALYVISLVTCYFAYQRMSPGQLEDFGYSLISIITFSSNVFFWWKDDRYFSQLNELNPVVHTWSLAVEEQFYLVFPLLCLLFFLAQWGGNIQMISKRTFYMFFQHSWASFYMPIGRIWELLLGSFVAFYSRANDSIVSGKSIGMRAQVASVIGLSLILISIMTLDSRSIPPFPNCYTMVPTFGASLIIIYGKHDTLIGRLLSLEPVRWIGLISYSAYLWHQPLLVCLRLGPISLMTISHMKSVIVIILLLSAITYYSIEQPFRNRTLFSRRVIFGCSAAGAVVLYFVAVFLIHTANYRTAFIEKVTDNRSVIIDSIMRNGSLTLKEVDTYLADIEPMELSNYVTRRFDTHLKAYPTFSKQSANTKRRLLLIGDSFAQDFMNMIAETNSLQKYEIRCYYIRFQCQIYMGDEDRLQWIASFHRSLCINDHKIQSAIPMIREADVIILAGFWLRWSAIRLPRTIELLNLTKSQKLLVLGLKNFGVIDLKKYMNMSYEFRIQQFQQPEENATEVNTIMKQSFSPSVYIDTMGMVCVFKNNTCPIFTPHGKLITYDGWHTMKHGARYVGDIIFSHYPLNQL
ncbi:unnamed protein product [Adineta ricciae]|uniref:Acyltransferase n=1 Tax=Adineta ricciae TaxID=249248 RepID=A0A813RQW6_ADIRI|nr:unnamed protein product [Adineta ricciae]